MSYWGRDFWAVGYECWSTINITVEMVNDQLEYYSKPEDRDGSNLVIEK